MKRITAGICALAAAFSLRGANTYVDWTEHGGSYSGAFTDVNRWTPATYGYPGSIAPGGEGFVYPLVGRWNLLDADLTVTFPAGTYSTPCSFEIFAAEGRVLEFSGDDVIWELPATDANAYLTEAFRVGAVDSSATLYKGWDQWGTIHKEKTISLSNFNFRVSATNGVRRLDFLSGRVDFTPRNMRFFDGVSDEDMIVSFASDATAASAVGIIFGAAGPRNTLVLSGQTGFNPYSIAFAGTDPARETVMLLKDGTSFKCTSSDTYFNSSSRFHIGLSGSSSLALRKWHLGSAAGARATIALTDGSSFSPSGTGAFGTTDPETVASSFGGMYVTNSTAFVKSEWTVNNGEIVLGPGSKLEFNSLVALAGGNVDGGSSLLVADGGSIVLGWGVTTHSSKGAISGFDRAELTENGLTFAYGNNYVSVKYGVPQNFTDAPGREGRLVFTEKVNAELTGADSDESVLEIGVSSGYRVTMKDGARHYSNVIVKNGGALCLQGDTQTGATFRSLTLGTPETVGVLELDAHEPVTVDGPIAFVNGQIKFSTTLANGTYTVFKTTAAAQTGTAVRDWIFGGGFAVVDSIEGFAYCKVVEEDGLLLFQIVVSDTQPAVSGDIVYDGSEDVWKNDMCTVFDGEEPKDVALGGEVEAGAMRFEEGGYTVSGGAITMPNVSGGGIEVRSGSVGISSGLSLYAATEIDVAAGAALTLAGDVLGVGITKTGLGELAIGAPSLVLADGLTLKEGTTSFVRGASYDTALNLAPDESTGLAVVRADEDVEMDVGSVSGGSLVKWGSGRFTLRVDKNVTLNFGTLNGNTVPETDYDLTDSADTASKPHGPLGIAEGELVIRGVSETRPSVTLAYPNDNNGRSHIGLRTISGSCANPKEPGLVIDHANVYFTSQELQIGYGLQSGKSFSRAPYLVVTNGSNLSLRNLNVSSGMPAGASSSVYVESSSLSVNQNYANNAGWTVTNVYTFVDGSTMYNLGAVNISGSVDYSFDRSGLYGSASNSVQIISLASLSGSPLIRYAFRNGSCFASSGFKTTWNGAAGYPINLVFEDSEWYAGSGDKTLPTVLCNVITVLEGDGLTVKPAAGETWTYNQPMTGEGAFVKEGAGAFVFAVNSYAGTPREKSETLCYTGLTDIREGRLVVSQGAVSNFVGRTFRVAGELDMSGGELSGADIVTAGGVLSGAVVKRPRFTVGYDGEGTPLPIVLDFENGLELSGCVFFDFGVTEGTPYPRGTVMTAARWTGSEKPDVSRWRGVNVGDGLICVFTAKDDGSIEATVTDKYGFVLTVR